MPKNDRSIAKMTVSAQKTAFSFIFSKLRDAFL